MTNCLLSLLGPLFVSELCACKGSLSFSNFPTAPNLARSRRWFNDIGVPTDVGQTLILLTSTNVNTTIAAAAEVSLARASGAGETGANLLWEMDVQIMAGLFFNNATLVQASFDRIYAEVIYTTQGADGIQLDGSFHQHGPELLAGSYGSAFTSTLLSLLQFASGTRFYMDADRLSIFAHLVLDGQAWMIAGTSFDWSVVGREITRPAGEHLCGFVTAMLRNVTSPRSTEFQRLADQLDAVPNCPPLVGFRHFPDSDYVTQHRTSWSASVRMYSNRTVNARCINDEGTQSEHTADGVLNLYYTGHDYDAIYPVWDWQQLPGVVGAQQSTQPSCSSTHQGTSESFVGGVGGRNAGGATQALTSHGLTTLRTWAFGDVIAALATRVTSADSGANVTLTAASRLLTGPVTVQLSDSSSPLVLPAETTRWLPTGQLQWLHHNGTGYLCLGGPCPAVLLVAANRTGNWASIGVSSGNVTLPVLGVHLQLGAAVRNVTAGYVVVPDVSVDAMPAVVAAMANVSAALNGTVPAVRIPSENGTLMVASFEHASGGKVSLGAGWSLQADAPAVVLLQEGGAGAPQRNITLAVSSHDALRVVVQVDRDLVCTGPASGTGMAAGVAVATASRQVRGAPSTAVTFTLPTDIVGATLTAQCVPA